MARLVPNGCEILTAFEGWRLYARPEQCRGDGWFNFVLVAPANPHKLKYWGGWNRPQQHLVHNRDMSLLKQYHPTVYAWLEHLMQT